MWHRYVLCVAFKGDGQEKLIGLVHRNTGRKLTGDASASQLQYWKHKIVLVLRNIWSSGEDYGSRKEIRFT